MDADAVPEDAAPGAEAGTEDVLAAAGVSPEELELCVSVLQRLAGCGVPGDRFPRHLRKALVPLVDGAKARLPQLDELDRRERNKEERRQKHQRKQQQLEADRRWKEMGTLRASRLEQLQALEGAPPGPALEDAPGAARVRIPDGPAPGEACAQSGEEGPADAYARQQACYICKARFHQRHHFYSHLCPPCAALNWSRRQQRRDLTGRVCLVTGARVKIGFQTALKLLRMGARVIATTRFPADARRRYAAEGDAEEWMGRLELVGIDFRFLTAVEAFCQELLRREAWLDVLINNACQTVRRPAAYYRHLLEPGGLADSSVAHTVAGQLTEHDSAALSQLAVIAEDRMTECQAQLPQGESDVHGQQLDTRSTNSWLLRLGEVSTPEAVEVFCINTLAPFVLNGSLRPLLQRSPCPDRYIVNVSAMEGKFYRYKQPTHPHTNMAKAAVNMMTRTSAEEYARQSGIFMNSVDTGWINDENPLPTARRIAEEHGFQTPIDEVDAAARILDPVLSGMRQFACVGSGFDAGRVRRGGGGAGGGGGTGGDEAGPPWGRFFKDYATTEW